MTTLYTDALADLGHVFDSLDDRQVDQAVKFIAESKRIALYGVGREGLQIKGFCMRLFHLGLAAWMVGDMTTPPIGQGDLLVVSAGPGCFSTVKALMGVARTSGARVLLVTAEPEGECAALADMVLQLPAQTMANDLKPNVSVLPMGSVYEGAQFVLFEVMVLKLRDRLGISAEDMRANHTNLE